MNADNKFIGLKAKPGVLPEDSFKAYVVSKEAGWGRGAFIRTDSNGVKSIHAMPGLISLNESIDQNQDATLISFLFGNEHYELSFVQHPVAYDFHLPSRDDLPMMPGFQPIPLKVIARKMTMWLQQPADVLTYLRVMRRSMRIIHVMSPPPVTDEHVARSQEALTQKLIDFGLSTGPNPLSIRLKYYGLYQEILEQLLTPLGVEIIRPPIEALNSDGSLMDQYAHGLTHSNEAYGRLVAAQLASVVKRG